MADHIAVFRWEDGQTEWVGLSGSDEVALPTGDWGALRSDKPQMRRMGSRLVLVFPVRKAADGACFVWHLWDLPEVPDIAELPARTEELRRISQTIEASFLRGQAETAHKAAVLTLDPLGDLLNRLAPFGRPKRQALLKAVADAIVTSGLAAGAAVMVIPAPATKPTARTLAFSQDDRAKFRDEYRYMAMSRRDDNAVCVIENKSDTWEVDGFAEMQDVDRIGLFLPPIGTQGLGFVLTDPHAEVDEALLKERLSRLSDFYDTSLNLKRGSNQRLKRLYRRGLLVAATMGLVVWLALPAPIRVTATVLTEPAQSYVEALPEDAFLRAVLVSPGEIVARGDELAMFSSLSLEEQLADAQLRISIERLTGQAALSQNDYGAYAISESRVAMEEERLQQLEDRIGRLVVRSEQSGRVISALPNSAIGSFMTIGTEIARLQPQDRFDITLDLASLDAPPIEPGQAGSVWFRGMSGEDFTFEVSQPAVHLFDETTNMKRLVARGVLQSGPQDRLIVGLSGFAKVEIGEAPRVAVLARYVTEYMREKMWLYLNIQV